MVVRLFGIGGFGVIVERPGGWLGLVVGLVDLLGPAVLGGTACQAGMAGLDDFAGEVGEADEAG